jgi:hypothetical protein
VTDVRVKRIRLAIHATDAAIGVEALREAEALLPEILEGLAAGLGDELLVLKKVEVGLLLQKLGSSAIGPALRNRLDSVLASVVSAARNQATPTSNAAWYPSEAHAMAAYLGALAHGGAAEWPFSAFADWGATSARAFDTCLTRGAGFLADVIAEIARDDLSILDSLPESGVSAALGLLELGAGPHAELLDIWELPNDVGLELLNTTPRDGSRAHGLLALLASLFRRWPPARGLRISVAEFETRLARTSPERRPSSAGGLVFWAEMLRMLGLEPDATYSERRVASAVRWGIARALETASVQPRDPLLLAFTGEVTDLVPAFEHTLRDADPEPLHGLAMAFAARKGYLDGELRVVPLGDERAAVTKHGIVLDSCVSDDAHAAVPQFVQNLVRRANGVSPVVEVVDALDSRTLDWITEVDAVFAPEAWRPALRAFTSVLRHWLMAEFGAELRVARGWRAMFSSTDGIELRRSDVQRLNSGRWLRRNEVEIGDARYRIELV